MNKVLPFKKKSLLQRLKAFIKKEKKLAEKYYKKIAKELE